MVENNEPTIKAVGETIEMAFCPCCGGKLEGLTSGKKETCPFDDCGKQFSVRIY